MYLLEGILVVVYGVLLWYEVRVGLVEYAEFKQLTATTDRQKAYRTWLTRGFLVFCLSALAGLVMLDHWNALATSPPEFSELSRTIHRHLPDLHLDREFLIAFSTTLCLGVVLGALLAAKLANKGQSITVGDIEPMMPRNWTETAYTFLLSLNAGLGEELFFRLLLPLLLALLTQSAFAGFAVSAVVFGAMHVYQGVIGVLVTMIVGIALTIVYLATGSIWAAVAVHAGLDIIGLVVRPTLVRYLRNR